MLANFLDDLGVEPPVYIRKMDKKSHWDPENVSSPEERVRRVAEKVFTPREKTEEYSIWLVNSNIDFCGIVADLSANRNPMYQILDFICITKQDLQECKIIPNSTDGKNCLFVKHLHYDIKLDQQQAQLLCQRLIEKGVVPIRCPQKSTRSILDYQAQKGCKAIKKDSDGCECEKL
jgi:hypothetical protein